MFEVFSASPPTDTTSLAMILAFVQVPIKVPAIYAGILAELFSASSAPVANLFHLQEFYYLLFMLAIHAFNSLYLGSL
jgi:hypothetical protein